MTGEFESALIELIIKETGGKSAISAPDGSTSEVLATLATQLGSFIALAFGGNQKIMGEVLDRATMLVYEAAADKQRAGQFLAAKDIWMRQNGLDEAGPSGGTA